MTINKASFIFPITNLSMWLVVSVSLMSVSNDMLGVVLFPIVIFLALNIGLVKLTKKVPYCELKRLNVVASVSMLLIVTPFVFINAVLAGVLFVVHLLGGVFYILLMTNPYHGNFIYRRSATNSEHKYIGGCDPVCIDSYHKNVITPGRGSSMNSSYEFNNTKSSGDFNSKDDLPVAISLLGVDNVLDAGNTSSVNYNPANGLPMMDDSFDVLGNVHGTSGTHNEIASNNYIDTY